MKSIIEQLYAGNIAPCERRFTPEYRALNGLFSDACDAFRKSLSTQQRKDFEQVLDRYTQLMTCDGKELFHVGFCMGAQIMMEVLRLPDE